MDLNLRDLRYFETAAQMEHLGRAALTIARSQPALTKAIHRLEVSIGSPLFERAGRGVRLTPVGHVLLIQARELRTAAEHAMRQVGDFSQGLAGLVRIGSGSVTVDELLPKVCTLLLAQAPQVQVTIEVGPSMELLERLRQKQLDVVVGLLPPGKDRSLSTHAILQDDVVVAARRGHPVFNLKRITLQALLEYRWVLPSLEAPSRQWLDAVFSMRGLSKPDVQIEANSIPLLPRLIAGTDLLSFVSRKKLETRAQSRLKEVGLGATTLRRQLGATYRHGSHLSPAARRLMTLLQAEAPALLLEGAGE